MELNVRETCDYLQNQLNMPLFFEGRGVDVQPRPAYAVSFSRSGVVLVNHHASTKISWIHFAST